MKKQVADALNEELIKSGKHIAYTQTLLRANAKVSDPAVVQVVARENKKAEVVAGASVQKPSAPKKPAKRKPAKKAKHGQKDEVIVGKFAVPAKKPAKKSAKQPSKKVTKFLKALAKDAKERAAEGFDEALSVSEANKILQEIGMQPAKKGLSAEAQALFKKHGIKVKDVHRF